MVQRCFNSFYSCKRSRYSLPLLSLLSLLSSPSLSLFRESGVQIRGHHTVLFLLLLSVQWHGIVPSLFLSFPLSPPLPSPSALHSEWCSFPSVPMRNPTSGVLSRYYSLPFSQPLPPSSPLLLAPPLPDENYKWCSAISIASVRTHCYTSPPSPFPFRCSFSSFPSRKARYCFRFLLFPLSPPLLFLSSSPLLPSPPPPFPPPLPSPSLVLTFSSFSSPF